MVNCFEDLDVEFLGFRRFERQAEGEECISETLDTKTNRPVPEIAAACFLDRVMVDLNDLVEIDGDSLNDFMELLEVILAALGVHESRKSKGREVAHGDLIRSGILDDFSTEVGAADRSEILLVALSVTGIFVKHIWISSLGLSLEDSIPQLLGTHCLTPATLSFISINVSRREGSCVIERLTGDTAPRTRRHRHQRDRELH